MVVSVEDHFLSQAALPWVACCSRSSYWKEQQNCSFPCGQPSTLSFPKADPPSEAGPTLLAAMGWQLCVWLSTPTHWFGATVQFWTVSLILSCFDLQHGFHVCQWDVSWRRGNGKLFSTCAPVLMGDATSQTTAGLCCLCLDGSALLPLPTAILVLFVHLSRHYSLPTLRQFLGGFCHFFALRQNSYCVDICSLPYLPCLLWLSPFLKTLQSSAPLQYYIIFFLALHSCHSICYLSSQKARVVGSVIRVLGHWDGRKLVTLWLLLGGGNMAKCA